MAYKAGVDKKQLSLLPVSLDEYVPDDHICQVISAFTGQMDRPPSASNTPNAKTPAAPHTIRA